MCIKMHKVEGTSKFVYFEVFFKHFRFINRNLCHMQDNTFHQNEKHFVFELSIYKSSILIISFKL